MRRARRRTSRAGDNAWVLAAMAGLVALAFVLVNVERVALDVLDPLLSADPAANFVLGLLVGSAWGVPAAVAVYAERRAVKVPAAVLSGLLALVPLALLPSRRGPEAWEVEAPYLAPGVLAGALAGTMIIVIGERLRRDRTPPRPDPPLRAPDDQASRSA